ncbi:class I adenylate-forming enzyme family protein [Streptomyces sp. Wh19]|uniref:class I adenylate-forming enzyme family protein n=1 Tax=Streptomyces sp. Wh19 TaxID=3076629 RepID=UPI002E10F0A3
MIGEVSVAGKYLMAGYWRNPAETARRFRQDARTTGRVLHTGDFGWLGEDDNLYLRGRDDLFKRRGLRTSRAEIEAAATGLDGVEAAAAAADVSGLGPVVWYVGHAAETQVRLGLEDRLERPKVPDAVRRVSYLPRTVNGKVSRSDLVEATASSGESAQAAASAQATTPIEG